MNESKPLMQYRPSCQMSSYSRIYVEERALGYPMAQKILQQFPRALRIMIKHYKDVFNRPRQSYQLQKQSPQIILAVKEEPFLYKGPEVCEDFGHSHFYYASSLLNCPYHCDYCYLQGLYPSGNIVAFVNLEDFFSAVTRKLQKVEPLYLCTSYDTDLLAFEGAAPYSAQWIQYTREQENLLMEIRTKSANYSSIQQLQVTDKVILAWTLSPREIIGRYERGTPGLDMRMKAVRAALEDGWQVRLSLEPILRVENWQEVYTRFIEEIFRFIPASKLYDLNLGVFRMNKDYFKKIEKDRIDTDLFTYPMRITDGVVSYDQEREMRDFVCQEVSRFLPSSKIFV